LSSVYQAHGAVLPGGPIFVAGKINRNAQQTMTDLRSDLITYRNRLDELGRFL
jgi:hypothetical protein